MTKSPESTFGNQKRHYDALMRKFAAAEANTEPTAKKKAFEDLWAKLKDGIIVPMGLSFNLAYLEKFPQSTWSTFLDLELQKLRALVSGDQTKALEYQIAINKASMFAAIVQACDEMQSNLFL